MSLSVANHVESAYTQRQAANPKTSVWVAASAGSGKTKVLVDRVLNLLLEGVQPERILCLTFTRAAAAEMANRINQKLLSWATLPDAALAEDLFYLYGAPGDAIMYARARRLFASVLDLGLRIETLHAFCQTILKRFPLEAGVAPHFQIMNDHDAKEAIAVAREYVLNAARDTPELAAALRTVIAYVHDLHFPALMNDLASTSSRLWSLFERWGGVEGVVAALCARLNVAPGETPANVLANACAEKAFDKPGLQAAAMALLTGSDSDGKRGKALIAWLAEPRTETFGAYHRAFFTSEGMVRKTLITRKAAKTMPTAAVVLAAEAARLEVVEKRRKAAAVAEATAALLRLGTALLEAYRRYKDVRAFLDYDDLILTVRRLLEADGRAEWVLYKLDGGIDHLLIDEAQDTSAEQWVIIKILTQEFFAGLGSRDDSRLDNMRTVFAVGDRKQSIYSFQGAMPDHFESMRILLRNKVKAVGQAWSDVPLNVSFRSTPAVLRAVDAVFACDPARDGVILAGEEVCHIAFRSGQAGLVEVWPPVEPAPANPVPPWRPPVEHIQCDAPAVRLARLVARRIAAMVNGGEWLESRNRPVRASDIMVLVRRRSSFVEDLVRALKCLDVPVAGIDRMILSEQMAVMDLIALGNVLLLPEDDLTLAAVLKSPLIGFDEDQLFTLAYPRGPRTLWQALRDHAGAATLFGRAHDWLVELLVEVDYRRPYELYARVLGPLEGRRRLVARLGPDAEDAIDEFLALTLRYETSHVPSLQGFLHWLEVTQVEVKRDLEQTGAEAVRILTVHGAKGLQAPIVFLPDTLQAPLQIPRILWENDDDGLMFWVPYRRAHALEPPLCAGMRETAVIARDREYHRLLYVAMTRAEDRLYVCGWQTRQAAPTVACWYHLIHTALAPLGKMETDPILATLLPAVAILRLRSDQTEVRKDIIDRLLPGPASLPPPWARTEPPRDPVPLRLLVPSRPDDEKPPVRSPLGHDVGERFHRGRLIHRLLQSLPNLPMDERQAAAQHYLDHAAADLGPFARAALITEVLAVFNHPAAAPLFGLEAQAEVPMVGLVGARVISGQVDRLVVTRDSVIIADYKTDRLPPQRVEDVALIYRQQMAAYRAILTSLYPGHRINCILVWTDGPVVMPLPTALLDPFFPDFGVHR